MKIGFVGLGKLGLPCALAIEAHGGHQVFGTDASEQVLENVRRRHIPYREVGAQELLDRTNLRLCSVRQMVEECDIVFVAVQTPHDPRFEGITPLPDDRADFDYKYLVEAIREIAQAALESKRQVIVAVISTVLPGSIAREVRPLLNDFTKLCYNPFFIAMGTTIHDFMHPEFVLMGCDSVEAAARMKEFYATLHDAEVFETSLESAELTKVAYNTFIGLKIVFANTLMEICEGTGANVDDVSDALSLATTRLISPKYLRAGMGDGGGCHPRDNIAMSFLARKLGISYDLFESLMRSRERQTEWLANLAIQKASELGLPIVILGKAFKPETNLTVGSPAVLLENLLLSRNVEVSSFDPYIDPPESMPEVKAVFVVATKHEAFADWPYLEGSIVLDPWGYVPDRSGLLVKRIGRGDIQKPGYAVVEVAYGERSNATALKSAP